MPEFKVTVTRTHTVVEDLEVVLDAKDEDEAENLAEEQIKFSDDKWQVIDDGEYDYEYEVEEV
jgi:hypothetical protein